MVRSSLRGAASIAWRPAAGKRCCGYVPNLRMPATEDVRSAFDEDGPQFAGFHADSGTIYVTMTLEGRDAIYELDLTARTIGALAGTLMVCEPPSYASVNSRVPAD